MRSIRFGANPVRRVRAADERSPYQTSSEHRNQSKKCESRRNLGKVTREENVEQTADLLLNDILEDLPSHRSSKASRRPPPPHRRVVTGGYFFEVGALLRNAWMGDQRSAIGDEKSDRRDRLVMGTALNCREPAAERPPS